MSLNDWHPIRELREREAWVFENAPIAAGRRRVLIYSMDPWQLSAFEQFLHLAIERKGHEAVTVYFDGLLPLCAWENFEVAPPPRDKLRGRFAFMHGCMGIASRGISTYLDEESARSRAEAVVAGVRDPELEEMRFGGLPVGRIALRDLTQYSLGSFVPRRAEDYLTFRRHLVHAVMSVELARTILDAERPDIVVLVNGKSVMYSYMYELARLRGCAVTTWEEGGYFDASVVLANDDRAIDFPIDDASWQAARRRPLSPAEAASVEEYFARWRKQEARFYKYYGREERDIDRIRRALDIPPDAGLVSLFTNIIWDTNALGKDRAFASMFDWIRRTIDWAAGRRNEYLVIRAHPGESRLVFKTRTPIEAVIRDHYAGGRPPNVRIIGPESDFSSYEIAAHSRCCAVYTSTLGAELTLMGARPLICGTPFYSGRGVTRDIESAEQYFRILDSKEEGPGVDVVGLKKLLYLVVFKLVKRPEFFRGIHGHPQQPRIAIETFEGFPESMPVFDGIVDCILERRSFVSPPERVAEGAWR